MAEPNAPRTTVSVSGSVTVRQRPSLLLMKVQLRAAEATAELGLAKVKRMADETSQYLKRLGAVRVASGEPHFADQSGEDPLKARAANLTARLRPGARNTGGRKRDLRLVLTATWDIAAMSADETLMLVDRLRFETGEEPNAESGEESPSWSSPEEQVREMLARMQEPAPDDTSPAMLFVARLPAAASDKAYAEAFTLARRAAEQLAAAAGMRMGSLSYASYRTGAEPGRTDRLMNRQRCATLLAGCLYDLADDELVSDDPRAAEFIIGVHATYHLEPPG